MGKRVHPKNVKGSGRLMATLANGVLVCYASAAYYAAVRMDDLPPSQARELALAIQAAYYDPSRDTPSAALVPDNVVPPSRSGSGLLGEAVAFPAESTLGERSVAEADVYEGRVEAPVQAPVQAPVDELMPSGLSGQPPSAGELPLRLSQVMASPAARAKQPRWMTLPDQPTRLRSSQRLSMPGAAGIGQAVPGAVPGDAQEGYGGDGGVGRPELPPQRADGGLSSVPPPSREPNTGLAGSGWEIPPIRWGGSLGYSLQKSSSSSGNSTRSQGVFANLSASSYLYAPWFATVAGRLGFTTSSSSASGSTSGGGDSSQASNVIGGGEVNVFSSSRYPFRAYFDRSDSRANGTIVSQDFVNTRFGLTQNYRAEDSLSSGNFMLDRSASQTSDGRKDSVTALSGSYSRQLGLWQHNVNGRYSVGQRDGTGEMARLLGFNTSHNANLSDTANLSATVNYSDSDLRTSDSAGGLNSNRGRYLQVYTYGSWMPEFQELDDLPLTLNGSLRYGTQESSFGATTTRAQTIGANLSGLYRFSGNLTAAVNTALNHISVSEGDSRLLTLVGSSVNYVGNPLNFGKFSYNWNVSGNANWQSGSGDTPSNTAIGGNVGHSLGRVYALSSGQNLSLNFSQTVNVNNNQQVGTSESLSNNLSTNYGLYLGDQFSGSLSAMFSDVYTTGVNAQHYKNTNVGLYGQGQLSQQSSINMNLTFNWSDQTNQTQTSFGGSQQSTSTQRMTLNGNVNYSHQRFAGVRGLRYNLMFAADTRLRDDRLYGDFNAAQDKARFTLTNRLDYSIGLLNFRLSLANNDVGGKKNALLFFQVTRQIGAY